MPRLAGRVVQLEYLQERGAMVRDRPFRPGRARRRPDGHTAGVDLKLPEPVAPGFERWVASNRERALETLTFAEIRKGAQALSSLYLERRGAGRVAERSVEGRGKRAAFASYYAPLHFLATAGVLQCIGADFLKGVTRVHDLGCGTGAVGAAVVAFAPERVDVSAIDRSGWALAEAKRSYQAFGARARTRRGILPRDLPRKSSDEDLFVLGWFANELASDERDALFAALLRHLEGGARLLLLEPLAGGVSPWWSEAVAFFESAGVRAGPEKWQIERPDWIAQLDRATLLDHRSVGARYLIAGQGA
jgi:SAM-dependent methyltransferase